MTAPRRTAIGLAMIALTLAPLSFAREPDTMHAQGTFDLKFEQPATGDAAAKASGFDRLTLSKRFSGALAGSSRVEMLALGDGTTDGAYVALETFTGTLDDRSGGFALRHSALMRGGKPEDWNIVVIPGSGTGALAGLEGTMTIRMVDKQHHYDFAYTLPDG